jgi:putative acetyltransferase
MNPTLTVLPADLDDPRVVELLTTHATRARAETGQGSAHALDVSGLKAPDIEVFAAWDGEKLLAVGALRTLTPDHGEVKSMHTAEAARRTGAGGALLNHLIETARALGMGRLSLETGSWPYFEPARTFYRRHGFIDCGPFGDYQPDPNSVFMTMLLG